MSDDEHCPSRTDFLSFSHTFELSKVIRYHDTDEKTRELVWNDSVHLNEYGYEVMGRAIAQRLLELLKEGV